MTREERQKRLGKLSLAQAERVILDAHEMLDRAGIEADVAGHSCDDKLCYSHLTHRIHLLTQKVKEKAS